MGLFFVQSKYRTPCLRCALCAPCEYSPSGSGSGSGSGPGGKILKKLKKLKKKQTQGREPRDLFWPAVENWSVLLGRNLIRAVPSGGRVG